MASRKDAARTRVANHVNDIHDRLNRIGCDSHSAELTPDDIDQIALEIKTMLDATILTMTAPAVRSPFVLS